ncbi:MAG: cysteine--tRNA ligase, partial [Clostridiales bacterium]|nr:cysteine--tRNA ligase [Clostridiales bacterium]
NEIAQSEAREGRQTVNYWMHGEFMLVDGGKMSKSLGNTYTIDQLIERGYYPLAFRYFCLNAHYRKKLNFTFVGLDGAQTAYNRLLETLAKHKASKQAADPAVLAQAKKDFADAVNDDLNLPLALGVLWTLLKSPYSSDVYKLALEFDKVLGLGLDNLPPIKEEEQVDAPDAVRALAEERKAARAAKNWAESDRLRDEIAKCGYAVLDGKDGYTLKKL